MRAKVAEVRAALERTYDTYRMLTKRLQLPAVGRRIRIRYSREYIGTNGERMGKNRAVTRKAVIIQKGRSHFTVELIPEQRDGYQGGYRLGFMYVDIVTGRIKVREVGG